MTKEEIIKMAKQAGFYINDELTITSPFIEDICISPMLKEFAKLVAEKEHERFFDAAMKSTEKAVDVAMALEREACAKIVEEPWQGSPKGIAEQIRARGQE